MIASNSLVAFNNDAFSVDRAARVGGVAPVRPNGTPGLIEAQRVAERRLDAVPPQPTTSLPRGSLLDRSV